MVEEMSFFKSKDYLQYQLPVKILDAAENLSKKVMNLRKDTYGDLYFDLDNQSKEISDLKRTGEIMNYWINKLLNLDEVVPTRSIFRPKVETKDQEVQIFFKDLYFQSPHKSEAPIQEIPQDNKKKPAMLKRSKVAKINSIEVNFNSSSKVTEMRPFKLGSRVKKIMKEETNKLPKFILDFRSNFLKNKSKIMKEIRPVPVKLTLK